MITKKDVQYIAGLARIHLTEAETEHFTKDLEAILGYIGKLLKLDVSKMEPTSHALPLKNVYRKDEIKPSLSQEEALRIAVAKQNGSFKVPQVIE
jgi:aspartyl-tRNA(Asn)/glutamyl-tRNA(Gln) amidotransferase subunit C